MLNINELLSNESKNDPFGTGIQYIFNVKLFKILNFDRYWSGLDRLPCSDWWFDILHGIIDGHTSGNTSARWINVHMNWFYTTFRLQEFQKKHQMDYKCKLTVRKMNKFHTWRNSNWATINELILSLTPPIKQIIRSFSNREKISYDRSPRPVCSITIGTNPNRFLLVLWIWHRAPIFYRIFKKKLINSMNCVREMWIFLLFTTELTQRIRDFNILLKFIIRMKSKFGFLFFFFSFCFWCLSWQVKIWHI